MELSLSRMIVLAIIGLGSMGFMFLHPVGPVAFYQFITPFDGIFFRLFRFAGNLITLIPIAVFYMRTPVSQWGNALLGTRIQLILFVWIVLLFISHLAAIPYFGSSVFLSYARKVTYVFVVMVYVWYWRDHRYLGFTIALCVISMAGYTLLSMADFYLGVQLLPVANQTFEGGALGEEYAKYKTGDLRFTVPGLSENRYAGYLIVFSGLGLGWYASSKRLIVRMLALGCVAVNVVALLATASRSGALGLGVSMALLGAMVFRLSVREMAIGAAALAVGGALIYGLSMFIGNIFEVLTTRFDPGHVVYSTTGRMLRWVTAIQVWASSPLWGCGDDVFVIKSGEILRHQPGGKGSHNFYTKILAEGGLLGTVPFLLLLAVVTRTYLTSVKECFPTHDFWRPYFFAGFVGISVQNVFNDYGYERVYWMTFSYAAVLQWCAVQQRNILRKRRFEAEEADTGPPDPLRVPSTVPT